MRFSTLFGKKRKTTGFDVIRHIFIQSDRAACAIILLAMEVYVELAIAENFCMDFTLLYAAKLAVRNRTGWKRVAVASALGACFAVLLPLFALGEVWSVVLKLLSGLLLCLIAGRFRRPMAYLKFTGAFFAFTALLGGGLIGIFSLAGVDYAAGEGYILSSVPVGIPLLCALLLILGARKIAARLKKTERTEVGCLIAAERGEVRLKGFYDSGNKVYLHGEPVSIVPEDAAEKLTDVGRINGGVKIHTVTGSKVIKVFTADLTIDRGGKIMEFKRVKMGISPTHIDCVVLHPDLSEELCLKK